MTRPTHILETVWPIEDPTVPLAVLRAEAMGDIRRVCLRERWTTAGNATVHVKHGAEPSLRVRVGVVVR